jgi:hypothetical protein
MHLLRGRLNPISQMENALSSFPTKTVMKEKLKKESFKEMEYIATQNPSLYTKENS